MKTRQSHNGVPKHSIGGVSAKYKRMADIYKYFASSWEHVLDFSDIAMIEHFNHISYGTPISSKNGYAVGESWLDVNVAMWNEDISRGHLPRSELYDDPRLPAWWLDRVLK